MTIEARVDADGSNLREVRGTPIFDVTGRKVGVVRDVYLDDATRRAEWLAVRTDVFATRLHLVPLAGAEKHYPGVQVPYRREEIVHSPYANRDGHLYADDLAALAAYYGMTGSGNPRAAHAPELGEVVLGADRAPSSGASIRSG